MKRLHAANDNDAGRQIARTRQIWQPRIGRDLTDDDARQIAENVTGFFSLLAEWSNAERRAANDNKAPSKSHDAKPSDSVLKDFGLTLSPSDDNSGVVVSDVDPNGAAAQAGLQPGDVILSVGSSDVTKPGDVETQIAAAKADGLKAVRLRVQSGDQTEFVALPFSAS